MWLSKPFGAHLNTLYSLDGGHGFNVCSAHFRFCSELYSFWNRNAHSVPLYVGYINRFSYFRGSELRADVYIRGSVPKVLNCQYCGDSFCIIGQVFEQETSPISPYVEYLVPVWWHYLGRRGHLEIDSASEDYDLGGYTWSPGSSFSAP